MSQDAVTDALTLLTGDAPTFIEEVWARRIGSWRRDPDTLAALLSPDDVDRLITSSALRTPQLRLARDGSLLPEAGFTRRGATIAGRPLTGLVDVGRTLAEFEAGATIVLQGLHRYVPALTRLVGSLEAALGHPCQANAYLTPPGAQGFAVHSDTHDVIVFQTSGSKSWEIHHPASDGSDEPRVEHATFVPGSVWYLPTGTPHAARTQTGVSLHVTIGINQLTWRTLLRETVSALVDDLDDGHLPAGYLDDPARLSVGLAERLSALTARLGAADPEALARDHIRRFATGRPARLRGGLLDRIALADLTATTPLRRRPGSRCVLEPRGDRLGLLLGDRDLDVPARLAPVIDQLLAVDGAVTAAQLRLDEPSALVLVRRLVREGLLELVR